MDRQNTTTLSVHLSPARTRQTQFIAVVVLTNLTARKPGCDRRRQEQAPHPVLIGLPLQGKVPGAPGVLKRPNSAPNASEITNADS